MRNAISIFLLSCKCIYNVVLFLLMCIVYYCIATVSSTMYCMCAYSVLYVCAYSVLYVCAYSVLYVCVYSVLCAKHMIMHVVGYRRMSGDF